ncbi:MAG: hypothetical protein NVS1B7_7760 [Candidatus Saccharimonadales bacterium]
MASESNRMNEWDDFAPDRQTVKLLGEVTKYIQADNPEQYYQAKYCNERTSPLKLIMGSVAVGTCLAGVLYSGIEMSQQLITAWQSIPSVIHNFKNIQ